MKLKTLRKKIRKLEARLQEGPTKLAKLKRKLEAMAKAQARKAKTKSAARGAAARRTPKASAPVKTAGAKKRSPVTKVKRKLNLSPERRAQLAAAMKARWAAKKAAAETNPQSTSSDRDFTIGEVPQSP
jgi:hypothetical protein